jgi:hypothetical protein
MNARLFFTRILAFSLLYICLLHYLHRNHKDSTQKNQKNTMSVGQFHVNAQSVPIMASYQPSQSFERRRKPANFNASKFNVAELGLGKAKYPSSDTPFHSSTRGLVRFAVDTTQLPVHLSNIELAPNEGEHILFDKPWSKYNKFKTTDALFMKIGQNNIVHEAIYIAVARLLRLEHIFLKPVSFFSECHSTESFARQFRQEHKFALPLFGMLVEFTAGVIANKSTWTMCYDPHRKNVLDILLVDYLTGHSDRPANCHIFKNTVYAVDNDGSSDNGALDIIDNGIQDNILHKWLQRNHHVTLLLKAYNVERLASLNGTLLEERVLSDFKCDAQTVLYVHKKVAQIMYRKRELLLFLNRQRAHVYDQVTLNHT